VTALTKVFFHELSITTFDSFVDSFFILFRKKPEFISVRSCLIVTTVGCHLIYFVSNFNYEKNLSDRYLKRRAQEYSKLRFDSMCLKLYTLL
jgi:hypothetical protein